jgi:hypothetical protein
MTYQIRLPKEPEQQPKNDGSGGTWNFQLRPTFWFGMTLCDTESAPEYTKKCTPDSDSNALEGLDPSKPDYIGKHPGNAYMELQFYGPGYVPQFEGFGCTATQYCAAMTIDSLNLDQATNKGNNPDCNNYILGGLEPINWAYVTKNGKSQAPANPLFTGTFDAPNLTAVTPDYSKDLMMNPGDRITIHMHDTKAGFRVDLTDNTTHKKGSMTASVMLSRVYSIIALLPCGFRLAKIFSQSWCEPCPVLSSAGPASPVPIPTLSAVRPSGENVITLARMVGLPSTT